MKKAEPTNPNDSLSYYDSQLIIVRALIKLSAKEFGVKEDLVVSRTQKHHIVAARRVAIKLCAKHTTLNNWQLAEIFHIDRTGVVHQITHDSPINGEEKALARVSKLILPYLNGESSPEEQSFLLDFQKLLAKYNASMFGTETHIEIGFSDRPHNSLKIFAANGDEVKKIK